jgi:hypothetical protein
MSSIGGWLGEVIFGGGIFGAPSLIGGTLFIFVGYWVGHRVNEYLEG